MTPAQLRMARALLRMKVSDVAEQAGVNKMTISALEAGKKAPHAQTVTRLTQFFLGQGVIFIGPHEPIHGATVALRWDVEPPAADDNDVSASGFAGDDDGIQAEAWDEEEEAALGQKEIENMRRYWGESGRWELLSEPSKKALARAMGSIRAE